ncbi:unnamed protein product [Fraxinus pennsylvanica]|uniref:Shikimate dehydrogenase substrate binding N-terminal domain-containing protein n=1 Tax=Fraxinus pennsylvanica TaxID=56036 RepID=A0AAD2E6D9_9LAMI|nr:unnamed protein product [Fraxinus pennsylvanica]
MSSIVSDAPLIVTIPHKEAALACCDEVDPVAKSIGAVNCIVRHPDGKLVGCNTDYVGAISAIKDGLLDSHNGSTGIGSPLTVAFLLDKHRGVSAISYEFVPYVFYGAYVDVEG